MKNETNKIPESTLEQSVNEHRGEIAIEQRMDLTGCRQKEENKIIKEHVAELRDGDIDKGIIGKLSEMATKNKLLRGAVIAGALLAAEPALGQMAINSKQIETAMMNFASGLRKTPQSAEEKFVQGINNPHDTENDIKHFENEKLAIPEKGTADYFIWQLSPEDKKEEILRNYRERLNQKQKHEQEDDKVSKNIGVRKKVLNDNIINFKKRPIGKLNSRSNTYEHFNSKNNQKSRIMKINEDLILQMKTQELQQKLLQNNYNLPKSNINISPNANIGNININLGARVDVGPNAQVGSIEAEEGADVQIGTARY